MFANKIIKNIHVRVLCVFVKKGSKKTPFWDPKKPLFSGRKTPQKWPKHAKSGADGRPRPSTLFSRGSRLVFDI